MFCENTTIIPFQRELKKRLPGIVFIQILPFFLLNTESSVARIFAINKT